MKQIPILRIPFSGNDVQFLQKGWTHVLESGFLTLGTYTHRFEELFQEFTGANYALAANSGTSALEIIIRALGIEGKSIIVPTNTFLASALAVTHSGNKVIFALAEFRTTVREKYSPGRIICRIRLEEYAISGPPTSRFLEVCARA